MLIWHDNVGQVPELMYTKVYSSLRIYIALIIMDNFINVSFVITSERFRQYRLLLTIILRKAMET